jgi:HlyD family secretion protein
VAPATGTVVWQVQAGDAVQAGQLLGKLSSPELEARLSQERAHADSLAADLRRAGAEAASSRGAAQAQVATAELALQAAQWLEKRQRVALDAGASSALQWEAARDALARARIELDQARQSATLKTEALKYELEARQALFQRATTQAQELARQAGLLQLRAPQAGAIGQRLVGDGATVARDAVLLTLVDLTRLDVQLQVPESLVRDLQLGQQGEVMVAGRPVAASLVALSPEVVNGEVAARLRFADGRQPADLRQNQRLSARVLLERRDAVLGVQRGPFIEQGGGRLAWVLKDGVALRRAVQLGAQSLDRVEVKAGLQAGEQVVVGGLESQPADTQTVIVSR